jgi:hypothetical protein
MKFIYPARAQDRAAIDALRVEEYGRSSDFALLDANSIRWNSGPSDGIVLAAWDDDQCVATMQGSVVSDIQSAQRLLTCEILLEEDFLPALVLTKAATKHSARRMGLNSALRYHFFSAARHVSSVLGSVYAGAQRTNLMAAIGYHFRPVLGASFSDTKDVRPTREVLLAILPANLLEMAIDSLRQTAAEPLETYPWRGGRLSLAVEQMPESMKTTSTVTA